MGRKKFYSILLSLVLIVGTVVIISHIEDKKESALVYQLEEYKRKVYNGKEYRYNTGLKMLLFLGIDSENTNEEGQADMISLAIFDRYKKSIKILMISRDSMVDIHQYDAAGNDLGWNQQHLALAYSYGKNPKHSSILTLQAVSKVLGNIPIVNYITLSTSNIKVFQDIVGNLTITLDDDYTDVNKKYLKNTTITLPSDEAETFVRYRDTTKDYSNEERMKRQKLYIEAYIEALKEYLTYDREQTIEKMYHLYQQIETNLTKNEIENFVEMIMTYSFIKEDIFTLEGTNQLGAYHDEFIINEEKLEELIVQLFYKEE